MHLFRTRLFWTLFVVIGGAFVSRRRTFSTSRHYWLGTAVKSLDTERDVAALLKGRESALVMFYMPMCPHCWRFAPTFEESAKIASATKIVAVRFASVNCRVFPTWCTHVTEVPTVILFMPPRAAEVYRGERTSKALLEFLVTRVADATTTSRRDALKA